MAQTNESLIVMKGKLSFLVAFDVGGEPDKAPCPAFSSSRQPEYSKPVEVGFGNMTGLIVTEDNNKICKARSFADIYAMGVGIVRVELEVNGGDVHAGDHQGHSHQRYFYRRA